MSKDDRHKVDFSVHCQSELNSIDFDSWNDCKDEGGKYLFSNLLEIHLSFKHFRCATLASYLDNSLAPSISSIHLNSPPQSSVQANFDSLSKSDDSNSRLLQSVLSSLHNESTSACESETCQLLPHPKHVDSSKQAVRFNTNDVHILVSKLKRFKKFNFNSTRAKLSCLQSKHYKASKDYSTVACNSWEGAPRAEVSTESGIVSSCELAPCHRLEGSSICESWNLYGKHNSQCIEIESFHSPIPVKNCPDRTTSDQSHLVESQFGRTPNTQTKHSCSFSSIPYLNLSKDVTHPAIPLSTYHTLPFEPSQFDYRSISEYNFTKNDLSHKIKADVCSLPTCMDNEMSSPMLGSNGHFSRPQNRMPSYVSISRAISGYAEYNKYCSEVKRDNSLLADFLSPHVSSSVDCDRAQIARQDAPSQSDQIDNFCSLPYEPTQQSIGLNNSSKSFLQKKIESLYGESFAENWKKSRVKSNTKPNSDSIEKTRSPSCPPSRIASEEVNDLMKSFQKINSFDSPKESYNITSNNHRAGFSNNERSFQSTDLGPQSTTQTTENSQDGHWFLDQLNQCTRQLRIHVDQYETNLQNMDNISDEVVGKIRTTIGKANLLINKKLLQFNQLCQDSIVQREDQLRINSDDLRGFWDMVLIQIEEVSNSFKELDRLKANSWKPVTDEDAQKTTTRKLSNPRHNINSPRSFSKLNSPKSSPKKDLTASPNGLERENERKNRLMEIKRKGKMKTRENMDEEITIFVPSADLELDK